MSKGGGKYTRGGRREGGKWDSQGVEGGRGWEPRSKGGEKWGSQGVEGAGGGDPEVMGAGSVREAGEERVESGIPKGAEAERSREKMQRCAIVRNRKSAQGREPLWKGVGPRSARYWKQEVPRIDSKRRRLQLTRNKHYCDLHEL